MFMANKVNFSTATVTYSVGNCWRSQAIAKPVPVRRSRSRTWAGMKPMAKCDPRSRQVCLT